MVLGQIRDIFPSIPQSFASQNPAPFAQGGLWCGASNTPTNTNLKSIVGLFCASGGALCTHKVRKGVKGTPLKTPCYGGIEQMHISHNGTPSKKTSCVCPARTLLHISSAVSSFASGCLNRRSSLQDTCKTRHTNKKAEDCRR